MASQSVPNSNNFNTFLDKISTKSLNRKILLKTKFKKFFHESHYIHFSYTQKEKCE